MNLYWTSLLIGLACAGLAGLPLYLLTRPRVVMPAENRTYLDPLPPALRVVWPLVRLIDHQLVAQLPGRMQQSSLECLRQGGLLSLVSPSQFLSLCLAMMLLAGMVAAIVLLAGHRFAWPVWLAISALGFAYPQIWLRDTRKKRNRKIQRALPAYLDFMTMGIEAGLNMAGAMQQAVAKGPAGPLKGELSLVLGDLRSGLTRAEALQRLAERVPLTEVRSFVNAVIQAERMGASLGPAFRAQAEQRRAERFLRAEKMAAEAPVKLIFPLIVFIFPLTFMVLAFPLAMTVMNSGVLK